MRQWRQAERDFIWFSLRESFLLRRAEPCLLRQKQLDALGTQAINASRGSQNHADKSSRISSKQHSLLTLMVSKKSDFEKCKTAAGHIKFERKPDFLFIITVIRIDQLNNSSLSLKEDPSFVLDHFSLIRIAICDCVGRQTNIPRFGTNMQTKWLHQESNQKKKWRMQIQEEKHSSKSYLPGNLWDPQTMNKAYGPIKKYLVSIIFYSGHLNNEGQYSSHDAKQVY